VKKGKRASVVLLIIKMGLVYSNYIIIHCKAPHTKKYTLQTIQALSFFFQHRMKKIDRSMLLTWISFAI